MNARITDLELFDCVLDIFRPTQSISIYNREQIASLKKEIQCSLQEYRIDERLDAIKMGRSHFLTGDIPAESMNVIFNIDHAIRWAYGWHEIMFDGFFVELKKCIDKFIAGGRSSEVVSSRSFSEIIQEIDKSEYKTTRNIKELWDELETKAFRSQKLWGILGDAYGDAGDSEGQDFCEWVVKSKFKTTRGRNRKYTLERPRTTGVNEIPSDLADALLWIDHSLWVFGLATRRECFEFLLRGWRYKISSAST